MDTSKKAKISFRARLFAITLKAIRIKSRSKRMVRNPPRSRKAFVPKGLKKSYKVETIVVNSKTAVTFERKDRVTSKHIIYLHGGSWIFEVLTRHWKLTQEIVKGSFCRMTMVDYPLAPENNYKETLQMLENTYLLLTEKYENDRFILMGDSAGGNIALSFVQKLINENISTLPIRNILFSPCVDLTFSNPKIKEVEQLDYILSKDLVQFGAAQYANGDDLNHFLLSPINGDLKDLPETAIFYGTHEILMPDILRLKIKAKKTDAKLYFYEYESMQHDWVLFSMPERQRVIKEVISIIGT